MGLRFDRAGHSNYPARAVLTQKGDEVAQVSRGVLQKHSTPILVCLLVLIHERGRTVHPRVTGLRFKPSKYQNQASEA